MKKILIALLVLVCALSFFACKKPSSESTESNGQSGSSSYVPPKFYTVTFVQEGQDDVAITVAEGKGIDSDDIPIPVSIKGHTASWSVTDFSQITSDFTVTAQLTPNHYTITYVINCGCETSAPPKQDVIYGTAFELAQSVPACEHNFKYWSRSLGGEEFKSSTYDFDYNITVYAVFEDVTNPY